MNKAYGLSIPETLDEVCHPQRIVLLVYDMQVGILNQIKNSEEITQQVLKVLSAARNAGVRVFFSRHLSLPKELMGMVQFRMAMAWQRTGSPEEVNPWFLRDAPGFQIVPELSPLPTEGVFDKLTMSAFEGTWLDFALRDCGINAFINRRRVAKIVARSRLVRLISNAVEPVFSTAPLSGRPGDVTQL